MSAVWQRRMRTLAWIYLFYAAVVDGLFVAVRLVLGIGGRGDILWSPTEVVLGFVMVLVILPAILPWVIHTYIRDTPLSPLEWAVTVATLIWTSVAWSVPLSLVRLRLTRWWPFKGGAKAP